MGDPPSRIGVIKAFAKYDPKDLVIELALMCKNVCDEKKQEKNYIISFVKTRNNISDFVY